MAKSIDVKSNSKVIYQIHIQPDFKLLPDLLKKIGYGKQNKICIVSDSHVSELYAQELQQLLGDDFGCITTFVFKAGEQQKNLDVIEELYEHLITNHFERNDVLLALGGGVVGDMTGFAAATYLRGIDFVQIPTSLLSQVDSSIGGKTGVDFRKYKNMVGAFYQPKLVYMNLSVLNTLPNEQFYAGMGEIIKHGLIKDAAYFQWLIDHSEKVLAKDFAIIEEMIYQSCLIKKNVVENDPTEKGERALLNFGHTVGHAIEKKMDFQLLHGECVALGVVAAAYLSKEIGNISDETLQLIKDSLAAYHLPIAIHDKSISADEIVEITKSDKKMEAGKIKFILLQQIGEAYIDRELSDEALKRSVSFLIAE